MRNRELIKLVAGFKRFRERYFASQEGTYAKLFEGQSPKTLIIGCSDSRVDPALISSASPGELFIVRNVANLVPPFESQTSGRHGVSAAIEFAVVNLKVENIIILGHRQCGGIRALMAGQTSNEESFIGSWMEIAMAAKQKILKNHPQESFESQCRLCEMEGIITSVQNLKSFPFIQESLTLRKITILGIYFDLEQGLLMEYDDQSQEFKTLRI